MNAPQPLAISSYDGSGQNTHPDVVVVPGGWRGYRYWLACTPYPDGKDRIENPAIRVSHDGLVWDAVPGAPDPIIQAPRNHNAHNADPDLVLVDDTLHLFYMTRDKVGSQTTFSLTTSEDGRAWSEPVVVYEGAWGVSPAVVERNGLWMMWYILLDTAAGFSGSTLELRKGPNPHEMSELLPCELDIPGHVPWHLDVQEIEGRYEALVSAFPHGTDTSRTRLFHAVSEDGVTFVPSSSQPILTPRALGWDGREIYRSSFVKQDNDYRIWYSASSWSNRWGIGYVEGPLESLRPHSSASLDISRRLGTAINTCPGLGKHLVLRHAPKPLLGALRALRGRVRFQRA